MRSKNDMLHDGPDRLPPALDLTRPAPATLLPLPGFMPDAVSYATRLALAMVMAYLVSFIIQLSSAASAGVCVAIVMQPSPGMAVSKAFYRTLGTVIGGIAALVLVGLYPQDRSMLLLGFVVWLGICTYVASLLRDFRSYGAVLAGYTVAVIAIGQIDQPSNALLATLDRVAAILVGVMSVAVVNSVFVVSTAHDKLKADLRLQLAELQAVLAAILIGEPLPTETAFLARATALLALRTDATYASAELSDGLRRNRAATVAVAALLDVMATGRELGRALAIAGTLAPGTAIVLERVAEAIRTGTAAPPPDRLPSQSLDALLIERSLALSQHFALAARAMHGVETGEVDQLPRKVRLRSDPDRVGGMLNAVRAVIATLLASVLCILGNDSGTTLMLIQISAFTALIGLQPNPSAAASTFLPALPFGAGMAALVVFGALPLGSGTVPFALSVAPAVFLLGLACRHPATAKYGVGLLIYFTILLSPSNVQTYDLAVFANLTLQLVIAAIVTVLTFRLLLPVRPSARLRRVATKVVHSLRSALHDGWREQDDLEPSKGFDRLTQAAQWGQARRPGPHATLNRLSNFVELDYAACRASSGLREAASRVPALAELSRTGQAGLALGAPDAVEAVACALLAHAGAADAPEATLRAASGLHGAALLLRQHASALRFYGVLGR